MTVPDWNTQEDWDVVFIGGRRMPGVASVDIKLSNDFDKKKPKGGNKARIRDRGKNPCDVKISLHLLHEEMADFVAAIPTLRKRSAKGVAEPLIIAHPNAALWDLTTIKVKSIGSPMPSAAAGYRVQIEALEHVEQPKAAKKAKTKAEGDWDVQPEIDALQTLPSQTGAFEENFSSEPPTTGSGGIPGSGFSEVAGSGF